MRIELRKTEIQMQRRRFMQSAACIAGAVIAQPAAFASGSAAGEPLSVIPADRQQTIEKLADLLEQRYVYPEIGVHYAAALRRQLARNKYDSLVDAEALATRLTSDLQAVAPDRHLRIGIAENFSRPRPMPADMPQSARPKGPPGLEAEEILPGDIIYLRFNEFPDDPKVAARARAFLLAHQQARALIIDCRPNRGGGIAVMNAILPLLYEHVTVQVRMDTRASADDAVSSEADPTLVRRASASDIVRYDHVIRPDTVSSPLRRIPIYYLTSRRTASAAEHLALALQRNQRATLVGETTAGANHFGDEISLGAGLTAFVPVGRSYDPDTGKDWERVGISPDVPVHADDALKTVLKLLPRDRRSVRIGPN